MMLLLSMLETYSDMLDIIEETLKVLEPHSNIVKMDDNSNKIGL